MTTLAAAVAIGDTRLTLSAPFPAAYFPGYVKVDDEVLAVVAREGRRRARRQVEAHPERILGLAAPATAAHNSGATVTYIERPYDAAFLAATAGEPGGGAIAVTGTDASGDPVEIAAATEINITGTPISDEGAGVVGVAVSLRLLKFEVDNSDDWDADGNTTLYTFAADEVLIDAFFQHTETWEGPELPDAGVNALSLRLEDLGITPDDVLTSGQGTSMNIFAQPPLTPAAGDKLYFQQNAELELGGPADPTTGHSVVYALIGAPAA